MSVVLPRRWVGGGVCSGPISSGWWSAKVEGQQGQGIADEDETDGRWMEASMRQTAW